jgi:hypothetical protein
MLQAIVGAMATVMVFTIGMLVWAWSQSVFTVCFVSIFTAGAAFAAVGIAVIELETTRR